MIKELLDGKAIDENGYDESKLYLLITDSGMYKLHKISGGYAFIDLESSNCWANGMTKTGKQMLLKKGRGDRLFEVSNLKQFCELILNKLGE